MARSSTRTALKKGANYLGMMSVLMQLRKVCNHPDLFEPRSVVTPFFSDRLTITAPACVIDVKQVDSAFDKVSPYLIHPLWSTGIGIPSFDESMKYDSVVVSKIHELQTPPLAISKDVLDSDVKEPKHTTSEKPGLSRYLERIWNKAKVEEEEKAHFHSRLNSWRCDGRSLPFPRSLVNALTVNLRLETKSAESKKVDLVNIAQTPNELLNMMKTQQERADDLESLMKKFIFCVPKAGSRRPVLTGGRQMKCEIYESYLSSTLLSSFEAYSNPFRLAQARLTSPTNNVILLPPCTTG